MLLLLLLLCFDAIESRDRGRCSCFFQCFLFLFFFLATERSDQVEKGEFEEDAACSR